MPRIRIANIPEGPGIPEEIRKEWIGVEFEAKGPMDIHVGSIPSPKEYHGVRKVYSVPIGTALNALKQKSEIAWSWFNRLPALPPVLLFAVESCENISS